jgi:hypothetical protein
MPYLAWQVNCGEIASTIKKQKSRFDSRGPHYPFKAEVYGADGTKIAEQVFATPFARPKIEVVTSDDWDLPVTVKYYDAHEYILSETIYWVTVETIESLGMQRIDM